MGLINDQPTLKQMISTQTSKLQSSNSSIGSVPASTHTHVRSCNSEIFTDRAPLTLDDFGNTGARAVRDLPNKVPLNPNRFGGSSVDVVSRSTRRQDHDIINQGPERAPNPAA